MTIHYLKRRHMISLRWMWCMALLMGMALPGVSAIQAMADHGGRWWQSPEVAQQLSLTEGEIQQLESAYEAAQLRMIELRSNVAVEKSKLRALLEQPDLDEAAIVRQHQSELAARSLLSDERLAFLLQTRKILGPERFLKLMQIRDAQKRDRYTHGQEDSGNGNK